MTHKQQTLIDLKRVSEVGTYATYSGHYFKTEKQQVRKILREGGEVFYRLTRDIYVVGREVMVLL